MPPEGPLAPLTSEQATRTDVNLLQARQALRDFLDDTTMAQNYHQRGNWSVWRSIANNTFPVATVAASLSTQVGAAAQALREIVEVVVPNWAQGPSFRGQAVKDHARHELKKAQMVNRLCDAGVALLEDYPRNAPRLDNTLQFLRDHARTSARWMQDAALEAKSSAKPRPRRKPASPNQLTLPE